MNKKSWISVSLAFTLSAGAANAANIEHYYQVSPVKIKAAKGLASQPKPETQYWRTLTMGKDTQIFDLCAEDESKPIATATGTDTKWTTSDGQSLEVKDNYSIAVTTSKGGLYAEGYEIRPIACNKAKKKPMVQPQIVEDVSEFVAVATGAKELEASRGQTLSIERTVTPTPGKPTTTERLEAATLVCKTAPMTQEAIRDLVDSPALGLNDQFYPGNLIRGMDLADGKFTPITLKRGPGKLIMKGVNFKDADAQTTIDVDEMSESKVQEAIKKLRSQEVTSNEGAVSFVSSNVYSTDQLAFNLGVDGRYTNVSFAASLGVDKKENKNTVLARLTQIYYTISVEDPETAYSPFCAKNDEGVCSDDDDKPKFLKDPEFQMGLTAPQRAAKKTNPPLYFKQIGYGRAIYFLASSTESSIAIKAALEGAYGNKDAGNYISVNSDMSYKSAMANTSVSYFVLGGNSGEAVRPIKAASPEKMYDEVRKVMASEISSQVGPNNWGVPISYTINYLTNRSPATLGYATAYDQTDCKIIPDGYYSFEMEQTCVDDGVDVSVINETLREEPVVSMGSGFSGNEYINLDAFIPRKDENVTVRIKEYNIAGPWCSNFVFKRTAPKPDEKTGESEVLYLQNDGRLGKAYNEIKRSGGALVGVQSDFKIRVNRVTGAVQVQQR